MTNADKTEIVVVLDRSGSMSSVKADTEGGFNTFIAEQKKLPGEARLTLVQFDTQFETVHESKLIQEVPPLVLEPRGMTALLDAVATTIDDTGRRLAGMPESQRPGKVVFVILTDGHENSSRQYTRAQVMEKITHQRDTYKWQFLFIGANQDAIGEAAQMGIGAGQAMNYAATAKGTQGTWLACAGAVRSVRGSSMGAPAYAFTALDRASAMGEDTDPTPFPNLATDPNLGQFEPLKPDPLNPPISSTSHP